ncbi:MAG: iron-containing alcohol dehydrogenase [Promethearchaeota archaeon]|nr:MAG: iron-containing alcohol dehydrogenase [Candidatus Lokiarchaeota archaeon]
MSAENIINNWKLTDITFGMGTLSKAGEISKQMGMKKALICIGGGSVEKFGYLSTLIDTLEKSGINYDLIRGIEPNPSVGTIYRIALKAVQSQSDGFIALGGGSVIDAAKAANVLVTLNTDDIHPYFGVNNIEKELEGDLLPLLPIPTTSGTSAEVTKYSNVSDLVIGVKKLISDPSIIPKRAIIDPELTISCPLKLTRIVGLDTLTHLMEGYLNNVHDDVDPEANMRAIEGMRLVFNFLPKAVKDGENLEARKMMSLACTLGGTVIVYKSTGGPHMNSFSWFSIMDHGEATALMLPYYVAYYGKNISKKLEVIANLLNLEVTHNLTKTTVEGLFDFYKTIGQQTKISDYQEFPKDFISKAINDASQNQMKLDNMPRPIPAENRHKILKTILDGAWNGHIDKILKL